MFIENKYKKWYDDLVEKRTETPSSESYVEKHHIVPKGMGGGNEKENLVIFSAREHYVAHLLLTKMCVSKDHTIKMMWAFHRMAFSTHISSHHYDRSRRIWSKFLKENHHSKRIPGWNQRMREQVFESWKNADERRKKQGDRVRQRWAKDPEKARALAIGNLPDPQRGKDNPNAKSIEYNGDIFYGWRELQEATGCTKFLYNKFYKNGIDPSFRIGKDGPMTPDEIRQLAFQYARQMDVLPPVTIEDFKNILTRMQNVGIITDKQVDLFINNLIKGVR